MSILSKGRAPSLKGGAQPSLDTWEAAKLHSANVMVKKQIAIMSKSLDKATPSAWVKKMATQDSPEAICVQWRIKNKPVFFLEEFKESRGWIEVDSVQEAKEMLEGLREEILAGKHDEAIKEAFYRPSKKSVKANKSV